MFTPPEEAFVLNDRAFTLRRPGRGGIARIPAYLARAYVGLSGAAAAFLEGEDGTGLRMEAVLSEYIVACPDDWRQKHVAGNSGRPALDFDRVDPEEFAEVGKRVLAFHARFRGVDAQFGLGGSQE